MAEHLVWLDADPGHDDAVAILLACQLPNIQLVGVSTVHGNTTADWTLNNAVRLLLAFRGPDQPDFPVFPGASSPLLRSTRADPEIHGPGGLGGVEGLFAPNDDIVRTALARSSGLKAIEGIAAQVRKAMSQGKKVDLIATGPLTNIALFLLVYPELLGGLEQICFMGGGVGIGNRSAVAEFNILCDPEAAQVVLNADVPKVMIPLNVTHQAILTEPRHERLKGHASSSTPITDLTPTSPFRRMMSTMLSFFTETYKQTFGFNEGPPLHDPLTIAYISRPGLFKVTRHRVDVDTSDGLGMGQTVVDVWRYRTCDDTWGRNGRNVLVAEDVNVEGFFELFFECVDRCDAVTPLNSISP